MEIIVGDGVTEGGGGLSKQGSAERGEGAGGKTGEKGNGGGGVKRNEKARWGKSLEEGWWEEGE